MTSTWRWRCAFRTRPSSPPVGITRAWRQGERIDIALPMTTTLEQMPDKSNYDAVRGAFPGAAGIGSGRPVRLAPAARGAGATAVNATRNAKKSRTRPI